MRVINEIPVYELNGTDEGLGLSICIKIESHWNYGDRVVIRMLDGNTITVLVQDLQRAITNAANHK